MEVSYRPPVKTSLNKRKRLHNIGLGSHEKFQLHNACGKINIVRCKQSRRFIKRVCECLCCKYWTGTYRRCSTGLSAHDWRTCWECSGSGSLYYSGHDLQFKTLRNWGRQSAKTLAFRKMDFCLYRWVRPHEAWPWEAKGPRRAGWFQGQPHQITGAVYSSVLKSEQTSQEASLT